MTLTFSFIIIVQNYNKLPNSNHILRFFLSLRHKQHNQMKQLLISLIIIVATTASAQGKYPYPMDIPVSISASFAELRANHFHAGLDMSTTGVIGIPVHTVEDGYVSRIKVSPYGYGHALYITHPDGHTTLYGHLSAYSASIDSVARAEQYRKKSFEIDLYLKPNALKVKKGEVVALSGNTGGSGGPHLHFEVRDTETEDALNPLKYLVAIPDAQAPTVYGVKLYGLDDNSQIAGTCSDRYYSLADIEGKTINVSGKIGVGMHAVDYFVAGHRPCGVVEIRLYKNDKMIFQSILDRIAFDETRDINSHIDYAERVRTKRFIQKSFVDPNNHLPVYHANEELEIAEGETADMRYELYDFNGNKRTVRFTLNGKASATATPRKHSGYYIDYAKTWTLDTLGISILIPHGALYKSEYADVVRTELSNNSDASIYRIGSNTIALHKPFTLTLPLPASLAKAGKKAFVAQVGDKSELSYLASTISNGTISAKPKTLGSFTVAVDSIAPKVWSKNSRTNLKPSNSVMIGLSDNLSGIHKYNVYIDGVWKCFEYDYKNARLISVVNRLGLGEGKHDLEAVIEDECGNATRWKWQFTIVK